MLLGVRVMGTPRSFFTRFVRIRMMSIPRTPSTSVWVVVAARRSCVFILRMWATRGSSMSLVWSHVPSTSRSACWVVSWPSAWCPVGMTCGSSFQLCKSLFLWTARFIQLCFGWWRSLLEGSIRLDYSRRTPTTNQSRTGNLPWAAARANASLSHLFCTNFRRSGWNKLDVMYWRIRMFIVSPSYYVIAAILSWTSR